MAAVPTFAFRAFWSFVFTITTFVAAFVAAATTSTNNFVKGFCF
jgi:hypothetical protein